MVQRGLTVAFAAGVFAGFEGGKEKAEKVERYTAKWARSRIAAELGE